MEMLTQIMVTRENECYVNDCGLALFDGEMRDMMVEFLLQQDIQKIFTLMPRYDLDLGGEYNITELERNEPIEEHLDE